MMWHKWGSDAVAGAKDCPAGSLLGHPLQGRCGRVFASVRHFPRDSPRPFDAPCGRTEDDENPPHPPSATDRSLEGSIRLAGNE